MSLALEVAVVRRKTTRAQNCKLTNVPTASWMSLNVAWRKTQLIDGMVRGGVKRVKGALVIYFKNMSYVRVARKLHDLLMDNL
jgi:hypothetical protein